MATSADRQLTSTLMSAQVKHRQQAVFNHVRRPSLCRHSFLSASNQGLEAKSRLASLIVGGWPWRVPWSLALLAR